LALDVRPAQTRQQSPPLQQKTSHKHNCRYSRSEWRHVVLFNSHLNTQPIYREDAVIPATAKRDFARACEKILDDGGNPNFAALLSRARGRIFFALGSPRPSLARERSMSRSVAAGSRRQLAVPSVSDVVDRLTARDTTGEVLTAIRHFPARQAQWKPMPDWVRPDLLAAYHDKGVGQLYSHQARAVGSVHSGRNVVIVTPTASGKTLCYNLPVLHAVLENTDTRAMYLFPTKALAQDQLAELHDLGQRLGNRFGAFTYDGDTPADARAAIRSQGHVVLTNPDMLHAGILPHHTRWTRLFENLHYIVLDELHTYRGVFGSHLANVLRRLRRVAQFYGSSPQFIACSATIANPRELAERLTEEEFDCIEENGAPAAEKFFIFYNPPVVNRYLGIRRGYIGEASRIANEFLARDLQTLVFANSRLNTELLLTNLQCANPASVGKQQPVRGYRGGYLPSERREIEKGLRDGRIRGVVATNALELGIDVGSLDAAVLAGYPGTIASTWQRVGRAGRREGSSCAVLVASSAPVDQFIVQHPEYFFGRSPEQALIQPDNLEILVNHLKCAAFELPLAADEKFGANDIVPICERLEDAGYLHRAGEHWHWTQQAYPADTVSLRAVTSDNFVIVDTTGAPEVIGEVDFPSALTTVHPKAVYLHQGQQYQVERLDFAERRAYVRRVNLEYYTDAIRYTQVRVLEAAETARLCRTGLEIDAGAAKTHGDVMVRSQVVGFKKIKFFTNENLGSGNLELPENEMHTTGFWLTLERPLVESLPFSIRERQNGMQGLLYALESVATLLLMCDRRDLGAAIGERPPSTGLGIEWEEQPDEERELFEPNLYLYDAYPGGIGFSEPLYCAADLLLLRTRELISSCPCEKGCPTCVGPSGDGGEHAKEVAMAILGQLNG
jgi:DEAD/DEAH box helicase domain-containing protein